MIDDDDEDDFFAYQTAKSLKNKRTQLKEFLQAPNLLKNECSSSDESKSEDEINLNLKSIGPVERTEGKELVKNRIDAIVTSCFRSTQKETKRKVKLGKRTAADDENLAEEEEYFSQLTERNHFNSLDKSQLDDDDEKVTRETAAYNRLDAVLRVTKPLCENSNRYDEENSLDEPMEKEILFQIDHSDGRQLKFSLPSKLTLKDLYDEVCRRLSLSSLFLVYENETLKIDDQNRSMTLKEKKFSSNEIQLIESYPLKRKLEIFIQTSPRSSIVIKRKYSIMENERFEKIFQLFREEIREKTLRFQLDGEILHPFHTPTDFDLHDGEILDAFILSTTN